MTNEINIDLGKRRSLKANIGVPGYLGKGDTGTGIESITYKGEDESGGNMYTVLLTDGTSYDITAPKGAKGDKGDKGDHGTKGDKGADGITPTIGDNGNWYLGATDTGKPSRGETGAKGDTGATGPAGPAGPQGPAGAPGKDAATDISLGITGATVGQIAKIAAVDDSGKPTAWEAVDNANSLPAVTASDNGKFLRVVNGAWAAAEIASAGGVSF